MDYGPISYSPGSVNVNINLVMVQTYFYITQSENVLPYPAGSHSKYI